MNPRTAQAHPAPLMPFYFDARLSHSEVTRLLAANAPGERRPTLVARFAAWRARRRTLAELRGLNDHELADIGLDRFSLHRAFEAPAAPVPAARPVAAPPPAPTAANDAAPASAAA